MHTQVAKKGLTDNASRQVRNGECAGFVQPQIFHYFASPRARSGTTEGEEVSWSTSLGKYSYLDIDIIPIHPITITEFEFGAITCCM